MPRYRCAYRGRHELFLPAGPATSPSGLLYVLSGRFHGLLDVGGYTLARTPTGGCKVSFPLLVEADVDAADEDAARAEFVFHPGVPAGATPGQVKVRPAARQAA